MLNSAKCKLQKILNQLINQNLALTLLVSILFLSCSATRTNRIKQQVNTTLNSKIYENQFTGILIVDPKKKDTLITINNEKYFIPASNVKIFTFYSGLQLIPDSIPTLKYSNQNDTLYFEGTGDPSWLHPYFKDSTAIQFLKNYKNLALSVSNFKDTKFGPGWAWEDYEFYFSPERGALPLYGNVLTINENDSLKVFPDYFKTSISRAYNGSLRNLTSNDFFISENLKDTLEIPFKTSDSLTQKLLQQQFSKSITIKNSFPDLKKKILYGIESDSIYKRMLFESDNFLAEQLMVNASSTLSDSLSFTISRDYILEKYLSNLKHQPRWVDGSGLSRYNLFTPESFVHVLALLKQEIPEDRLFHLFPTWNASGSVTKAKDEKEIPFIYAKSGGMGNVYNLSGYLKTKSGKILAFSFMNNHFRKPSSQIRQNIYDILKSIHESY